MAPKTKKVARRTNHKPKHEHLKRRLERRRVRSSSPEPSTKYRGFLSLPAEIKNVLYDSWAADQPTIFLRPSGPDFLTTTHPVAQLCRQTRDEFLSIITQNATFGAKKVVAQVEDFNFYYLEQFLNLVAHDSRADIGDFEDRRYRDGTRRIFVHLTLTESFVRDPPVRNLVRWLEWLDSFGFKWGLAIEYSFRRVAEPNAALRVFQHLAMAHRFEGPFREVAERLKEFIESPTKSGAADLDGDEEMEDESAFQSESEDHEAEDEDVEDDDEDEYVENEDVEDEGQGDGKRPHKLVYNSLTPEVQEAGWGDAEEDQ